ncbi:MAG: hypothetical protein AAF649_03525 [Verrucomicrobiota bacterium]
MKIALTALLLSWLVSGCASSGGGSQDYFSQHKSVLLEKQGPPDSTRPDGSGGEVWLYQKQNKFLRLEKSQTMADEYGQPNAEFMMPKEHTTTVTQSFYISSKGYIYKVR